MALNNREAESLVKQDVLREWAKHLTAADKNMNTQLQLWNLWHQVQSGGWVEVGLLLWARSFDSLRWALELILSGYAVQSATLLRQVWEDQLMSYYLEKNQDLAEEFYKDEGSFKSFKVMAKSLGVDVQEWWTEGYSWLSKIAHPRSYAVGLRSSNKRALIGPYYDKRVYPVIIKELLDALVRSTERLAVLVHQAGVNQVDTTLLQKLEHEQKQLGNLASGINLTNP